MGISLMYRKKNWLILQKITWTWIWLGQNDMSPVSIESSYQIMWAINCNKKKLTTSGMSASLFINNNRQVVLFSFRQTILPCSNAHCHKFNVLKGLWCGSSMCPPTVMIHSNCWYQQIVQSWSCPPLAWCSDSLGGDIGQKPLLINHSFSSASKWPLTFRVMVTSLTWVGNSFPVTSFRYSFTSFSRAQMSPSTFRMRVVLRLPLVRSVYTGTLCMRERRII